MGSNTDETADRIMTIALLRSFRALELFAASAIFGTIAGAMSSAGGLTQLLAALVCLVGFASFYMALRIRLDTRLFEQWDQFDTPQLDRALMKINPGFEAGRTLESRLVGARTLFRRGAQLVALQAALVVLLIGSCMQ